MGGLLFEELLSLLESLGLTAAMLCSAPLRLFHVLRAAASTDPGGFVPRSFLLFANQLVLAGWVAIPLLNVFHAP
jgi:hypothetical protein